MRRLRATRRQTHDFAITGGIALLSVLPDRTNVVAKTRCPTLPYLSDFGNNGIRLHRQSPAVPAECKSREARSPCHGRVVQFAVGGTGVSPVFRRSRPVSGNVSDGRAFEKTLEHLYRLKGGSHSVCGVRDGRRPAPLPEARFFLSRRGSSQPGCVAGFVGHGHFRLRPDFATYEGDYPLQIPSAHVRAGPRVSARGPHGECAGVPGDVLQGHRPPARTPGTGENALFGRGHSHKPRAGKHLEVSVGPTKTAQQLLSTQSGVRQGLRAFHGRPCWTLGRAISHGSAHSVFRRTRSSIPS